MGQSEAREVHTPGVRHHIGSIVFGVVVTIVGCVAGGLSVGFTGGSDAALVYFLIQAFAAALIFRHLAFLLRQDSDIFRPQVVAVLTYLVFYVVSLPLVAFSDSALDSVFIESTSPSVNVSRATKAIIAVTIGWFGFQLGGPRRSGRDCDMARPPLRVTPLFLLVGAVCVAGGVLANIAITGDITKYIAKMPRFFERTSDWETFSSRDGSFVITQLIRVLPMGVLVLSLGCALYTHASKRGVAIWLTCGAVANLFLSSATGGRGIGLTTFAYSLIVFNAYVRRLGGLWLTAIGVGVILVGFGLGLARGAAVGGAAVDVDAITSRVTDNKLVVFAVSYLTNDLRLLQVVDAVEHNGVAWGRTLADPIVALVEGRPTLTTGMVVQSTDPSDLRSPGARYGVLVDAYFNYGYGGVFVMMLLVGLAIRTLEGLYLKWRSTPSVAGGVCIAWASFTANYLVTANVHGLPKYFMLASVPVYVIVLALRHRKS